MSAAETLAQVAEALREYEEQHPAMFDSEGEFVRCFGGWLSDRGINLIGPSQAAPNRGPETAPEPEDTDDVEPERCTGASDCKVAVHYHGCYADVAVPPQCDEPEAHYPADVEPEPLKEGGAVRALAQAIIWTREYVGEATLPAMKGWSWYDALREYAPEFLPEEPTQCTSLYEYEEGKYVRCCRASGHANPDHQGYGKGWLAESARLAEDGAS